MVEHERFAQAAHSVARGLERICRERARVGEVTPQQAETLRLIADRGAICTSDLATTLGIDPSTASRNLAGLERAGFITRKRGTDDGRQRDIRLTPRGRRVADIVTEGAEKAFCALLERVPRTERGKLTELFELLAKELGTPAASG